MTGGLEHCRCGSPGCMTPEMLTAFLDHFEQAVRRQVAAEYEAAQRARWAPTREWLRRLVPARTWAQMQKAREFPPPTPVRQSAGWPTVRVPGVREVRSAA